MPELHFNSSNEKERTQPKADITAGFTNCLQIEETTTSTNHLEIKNRGSGPESLYDTSQHLK